MKIVVFASENPYRGWYRGRQRGLLNGVTTAVANMQRALGLDEDKGDFIYICPSPRLLDFWPFNRRDKIPKCVWSLPSFGLWPCLIPSWLATVDKGYRVSFSCQIPIYGQIMIKRLSRRLKKIAPCYPHFQGTNSLAVEFAAKACVLAGIPYELTLHTHEELYIDERVHISFLRKIAKRSFSQRSRYIADHAAKVTAPTKWFAERFREFTGFPGKIIIRPSIVWPFDLMSKEKRDDFEKSFRDKYLKENQRHRPLIGCLGRKSPEKNLILSLEVMAELKAIYEHAHQTEFLPVMVIAGPSANGYDKLLEAKARELGIIDDIVLIGGIANDEMLKVHQILGLEFFPALSETQGLIRVEAELAAKIPIVLENTALIEGLDEAECIAKHDPTKIAEKICNLLSDPVNLHKIGMQLRSSALKRNDPISYGSELAESYSELECAA